ncbi:MAG TPA: hypothetical protein PKA58_20125 [Polyangium sp.]|nr:hypothetical protein [Polyangium sp.]
MKTFAFALMICFTAMVGCGGETSQTTGTSSSTSGGDAGAGGAGGSSGTGGSGGAPNAAPVHVVLFTHIEDNTPAGMLGSLESRQGYNNLRSKLVDMAKLAQTHQLPWTLQPDWKILEAARLYEDMQTMASTNGKNVFRYLHEDLNVAIDPHSHENGGYNYTDVAHLLTLLEVGGSTVIGGHVWDPALPQFQEWDRYRMPVNGIKYPSAQWRGDILIGAGTPNHVNDPLVSGAWRPKDRNNYFVDDPAANILAFGAWHNEVTGVQELVDLRANGTIAPDVILTASWNIQPTDIMAPNGLAQIESSTFVPIAKLRDAGSIIVTDFTSSAKTFADQYGSKAFLYQP